MSKKYFLDNLTIHDDIKTVFNKKMSSIMNTNLLKLSFASSLMLCSSFISPVMASAPLDEDVTNFVVSNNRIYPERPSLAKDIFQDTLFKTKVTLYDKVVTTARVSHKVAKGDFTEFFSESINLLLAEFSGQSAVLFKGTQPEFDENALNKCADKFVEKFMDFALMKLNKRDDIFGIDANGDQVDIYDDNSFAELIADRFLPEDLPLRGALVALCSNEHVEKLIRQKLTRTALSYLKNLAASRGTSLKEVSGRLVIDTTKLGKNLAVEGAKSGLKATKDIYAYMTAEAEDVVETISDKLHPHLTALLREFAHLTLTKAVEAVGKQLDTNARSLFVNGARVVGAGTTYLTGVTLETAGSYVPYLGAPVTYLGSALSSTYAPLVGGYLGGFMGNALFDSTGENVAKRLPAYNEFINYQIFGYSRVEHLLMGMNPRPTEIERGLFIEDYEERDKLQRSYFVAEIIRHLASKDGDLAGHLYNSISHLYEGSMERLWKLFKSNKGISTELALEESKLQQYIDFDAKRKTESKEKAKRRLLSLSEDQSPLAKKVHENIARYPSYDVKIKKFDTFLSLFSQPKKEDQEKNAPLRDKVARLNAFSLELSNCLDGEALTAQDRENLTREMLFSLSIAEQDMLHEMIEDRHELLHHFEALNQDNMKEVLQGKIETYAAEKDSDYRQKNKKSLEALAQSALADGLSSVDIVFLHKVLSQDNDRDILSKIEKMSQQKDLAYSADEYQVLKNYFVTAAGTQRGLFLTELLKANLIGHNILSPFNDKIQKESQQGTQFSEKQIQDRLSDFLKKDPTYTILMNIIRKFREDEKVLFNDKTKSVFEAGRATLLKEFATTLYKQLDDAQNANHSASEDDGEEFGFTSVVDSDSSEEKDQEGWSLVNQSGSLDDYKENLFLKDLPNKSKAKESYLKTSELLVKNEGKLKTYDRSSTGVGLFNFAQHLNQKTKLKYPTFLNEQGLKGLQREVWQSKKEAFAKGATREDVQYLTNHEKELLQFREESERYRGRAFYGLKELLRDFKNAKEKEIRALF